MSLYFLSNAEYSLTDRKPVSDGRDSSFFKWLKLDLFYFRVSCDCSLARSVLGIRLPYLFFFRSGELF